MSKLLIDLKKIKLNTANIIDFLGPIELAAVTKGVCGDARIAKAMVDGGAKILADSRVANLSNFKKINVQKMLLCAPSSTEKNVTFIDYFILSTNSQIKRVNSLFEKNSKKAKILLMLESGFNREGFLSSDVKQAAQLTVDCPNVELVGFATNTACQDAQNPLDQLNGFVCSIDALPVTRYPLPFARTISGGNSSLLPWVFNKSFPATINQLRIGEAILLGHDTAKYLPVAGNHTDAFILEAPVFEVRLKKGRRQAVVGVGLQEIGSGNLHPLSSSIKQIFDLYSDYATLEVDENVCEADSLTFLPDYYALISLLSSSYVEKKFVN